MALIGLKLVDVSSGTPQGSILEPLLFLVIIIDMLKFAGSSKLSLFADDATCHRHRFIISE